MGLETFTHSSIIHHVPRKYLDIKLYSIQFLIRKQDYYLNSFQQSFNLAKVTQNESSSEPFMWLFGL